MRYLNPRLLAALILLGTISSLSAFTVRYNVNAGDPKEALLIFDHAAGHEQLDLVKSGDDCTVGYNESGAIEMKMVKNGEVSLDINWKPGNGLPESFNANDYNFLILRCQFTGELIRTFPNGRASSQEPGNPWFGTMLLDPSGERTSVANIAILSEDGKVPANMTDIAIPMAVFLQGAYNNPSEIKTVAFKLGKTHDYNDRNFTFTIERIALAN